MADINMVPWFVMFGAVAVITIAGNLLSITIFLRSHRLKRMRTSLLLISLSAADLVVGTLAIPIYIILVQPGYELARNRALHQTHSVVDLLSGLGSLFGLTVIALERVYSVFWPHKHRSLSKAPYYLALLASWSLAILLAILRLLQWEMVITLQGYFYTMFSWMTVVVISIIASYVAVWVKVKANRKGGFFERGAERENNLAKTLAILTAIFLITWLPFHVLNMVLFLCVPCRSCPLHLVYAIKLLHYGNSLANPVIYSFRFPEFRRALARIFCKAGRVVRPSFVSQVTGRERGDTFNSNSGVSILNKQFSGAADPELSVVASGD